jgi:hypothetical protein
VQEINFIQKICEEKFGINVSFHHMKTQNVTQILVNSAIVGIIFAELFGSGFAGKFLPKMVFDWDRELINNLLAGLITTDGCISKNCAISLQMSNKNLMNQLYHLFRIHGIDVSLKICKIAKLGTCNPYRMAIPKIKEVLDRTNKYYTDDRLQKCYDKIDSVYNDLFTIKIGSNKFLRIESIEESTRKDDFVYTLGVEEDHSYTVEGLICENCFLIGTDDSLEEIFKTITDIAKISKWSGGIGLSLSNIRSKGSLIKGTNGKSDGIIPLCRTIQEVTCYVNQCILPHIPVYSKNGIKRMDEITNDDYLITHDGSFRKVNKVIVSEKTEEILEIDVQGLEPLQCTKIHDIYTFRWDKSRGIDRLLKQLESGFRKPITSQQASLGVPKNTL